VTTTAEAPGAVGDCTLGEAIQAANTNTAVDACPPGTSSDLIVLAPGASYTLTSAAAEGSAFAISSTITLQGQGARLVRNPLAPPLRFFSLTISSSLTLIDLTLAGGLAQGRDGKNAPIAGLNGETGLPAYGGAIYSLGGALTLNGATFSGNRALGWRGGLRRRDLYWRPGDLRGRWGALHRQSGAGRPRRRWRHHGRGGRSRTTGVWRGRFRGWRTGTDRGHGQL
jgi:CSLREA domain-containing protein